jgi:hypothetical protein
MKEEQPTRTRGLAAIETAKVNRQTGRLPVIPTRFLLWTATVIVAWGIYYWRKTQGEIESQKAALFARQRGIVTELGGKFDPLRERIEEWTTKEAGDYAGEVAAAELGKWDFATQPGIYLRLRLSDATAVTALRGGAGVLRDAFTVAFASQRRPHFGPACKRRMIARRASAPSTTACRPRQPCNMRAAYHGRARARRGDGAAARRGRRHDDAPARAGCSAIKDDPLVIDLRRGRSSSSLDEGAGRYVWRQLVHRAQPRPHGAVTLYGLKSGMDRVLCARASGASTAASSPPAERPTDPDVVAARSAR